MINTEQIKTYKERLKALYGYLDIEKKLLEFEKMALDKINKD